MPEKTGNPEIFGCIDRGLSILNVYTKEGLYLMIERANKIDRVELANKADILEAYLNQVTGSIGSRVIITRIQNEIQKSFGFDLSRNMNLKETFDIARAQPSG